MLAGSKVVLRAWCESDVEALMLLRNDVALQSQLMAQPRPNSAERVREWLTEKSSRSDGAFFVVADIAHNKVVGYIQALNIDPLHGVADLGICFSPAVHGSGYGRESLTLLETYLQRTVALRKLVLQVLADNQGAIEFYRRTGFVEVGCMKSHFYLDNSYRDVLIMEKLLPS